MPLELLIIKATSDVHVTNAVVISPAFDKVTAASSGTTLLPGVPAASRGALWLVPAHLPPVLSPWPPLLSLSLSLGDSVQAHGFKCPLWAYIQTRSLL